jgi:hypothetical protein
VSRNNDREAQHALAEWVSRIATTIRDSTIPGALGVEVVSATPTPQSVNGQELPGYTLRVLVRA